LVLTGDHLAKLDHTIKQLESAIKNGCTITMWLDQCTMAVQLATTSYSTAVGKQASSADHDKHVEYSKQFATLLVSLLKLSGVSSLVSSSDSCTLCQATLCALTTACRANHGICYAIYEVSGGISSLLSITMSPSAKLSIVEEATKTITVLASTCRRICTQLRQHPGIKTHLLRLACSKSPSLCVAAGALQVCLQG